MFNKILIGIFSVLMVVVFVEVIYFFNQKSSSTPPSTTNSMLNTTNVKPTIDPSQYLDTTTLKYLAGMKTDVLSSAIVSRRFEGLIKELDFTGGVSQQSKLKYDVKLVLQGLRNGIINFYFSKDDLLKTKVILHKDGNDLPITLNELKVNDKIVILDKLDLSKNININWVEVTILKNANEKT